MGWQQKARGRKIAGTTCYLCHQPIDPETEEWNRDHVPPRRIFAKSVRQQFGPNLPTLPTHASCNRGAERNEAYFIVSFVGHLDSDVARAVMADIRTAAQKGEGVGLIRDVINRFGRVHGPNGEVLYSYDSKRTDPFLWKVVRGVFALEIGVLLPLAPPSGIHLINPKTPGDLERVNWFPAVRDTQPLGRYGGVFDYKWLGWKDGNLRGHAFAMNFWDGLLAAMLFHDPRCECGQCEDWKNGRTLAAPVVAEASDDGGATA